MEQLAQFVLGRHASPEEVQDLARAVAQSAEVEEAFGGLAGLQLGSPVGPHTPQSQPPSSQPHHQNGVSSRSPRGAHGGISRKHPWRRPGTPPRKFQEEMLRTGRRRRSVITPRRRRLRVPSRVLQLAAVRWTQAPPPPPPPPLQAPSQEATIAGAITSRPGVAHRAGGRRLLSELMLKRFGRSTQPTEEASVPAPVSGPPRSPIQVLQSEDVCAAVNEGMLSQEVLSSRMQAASKAAEALIGFLRGQRPVEPLQQRWGHVDVGELRQGRTGLPGLVRGRDTVVVLPQELLEASVGAWQLQEQRLMHPDFRSGRVG